MSWPKILTSYAVVAQITLAPTLSFAREEAEITTLHRGKVQANKSITFTSQENILTPKGAQNADAYAKYAQRLGYDSRMDLRNNRLLLIDRNTQKVAIEIPFRDQKTLTQYSPKNLHQKMSAEIIKVKTASNAAWSHTLRSFPTESAMFFIALGGMVAVQLFTDYANNPVGMKQHIDHQLSPVGQIGFFMFMYSQGVTANSLNLLLKKPKLAMPIGMLGMTVGLAVQTYFSQVVMDPHIRACAASIFKGEKPENNAHPCEGAYKYFVLDKKILEGPGVASLLGSFLLTVGGKVALTTTLKLIGFEIGMFIAPGGMVMRFGRLLLNGANIAAFTVIQMKLEHMLSYAWKNYFDGKEFIEINDRLVADIAEQKKASWSGPAKDLTSELKDFSKKMGEWRVSNLSEAYMAHQAWAEFLGKLTANYNASYNFYSTYTDHLNSADSFIDRAYPLFGVTPKGLAPGHESIFVTRPDRIERLQAETTVDVAAAIQEKIQKGFYRSLGFNKDQIGFVTKLQVALAQEDLTVKGQALLEMNERLRRSTTNMVGSMQFGQELYQIYLSLGNPQPLFETGRGFAESLLLDPNTMANFKDAQTEKVNGRFATANVADYFIMQMICGPEVSKNEKVITFTKGYPAEFHPPALALDNGSKEDLCFGVSTQPLARERIYNLPFSGQRTAPEYIRANIDPAAKDFVTWWEKGTDSQMREAFKGFATSYKQIVSKLFAGLNRTQMSAWNRGFIANGVMTAAFQELRLYSLILGEMLKDSYQAQHNSTLPAEYFAATPDATFVVNSQDYAKSKKPLLALLGRGSRYDFKTILGAKPNSTTHSLVIQKDLENQFALLNALVQKTKNSAVRAEEFQNQMKAVETTLSEFGALLGVDKESEGVGLVKLNEEQKALAVTCLELLQTVSQEIAMYGNMAATASYPDPQ